MEYEQFKKRYDATEFNIGVVPVDARKFFTESSRLRAEEVLGERLLGQFILVKGCWLFFWLFMLRHTSYIFYLYVQSRHGSEVISKAWTKFDIPYGLYSRCCDMAE